jgi:hypothetical protein
MMVNITRSANVGTGRVPLHERDHMMTACLRHWFQRLTSELFEKICLRYSTVFERIRLLSTDS